MREKQIRFDIRKWVCAHESLYGRGIMRGGKYKLENRAAWILRANDLGIVDSRIRDYRFELDFLSA